MTLDTVPWVVKGGAIHSAEVARSFAYAATGGVNGVTQPNDLFVRPLVTAGTSVRVTGGVAAIVNTYAGQSGQSYIVRNAGEQNVSIPATAGTARSDMLVLRIDDPQYGGSQPDTITDGPYAKFAIISNVGNTATAPPGGLAFPCIPLARIDIPANTGTITSEHIKDIRPKLNYQPVSEARNRVLQTDGNANCFFSFSKTFPAPPVVVATGGNGENVSIISVSTTGFYATFRNITDNAPKISTTVRCLYTAVEEH